MLTITVNSSGALEDLARLYARLGDLSEPMDEIGGTLETRAKNRFEIKMDPLGHPWAPWKESTHAGYPYAGTPAAAREEGVGKGLLLNRYGPMLDHLTYSADSTSVRVGFAQPYSTHHEYGTKHMERRGMLFADPHAGTLAPDDEATVLDILSIWLTGP